MGFTVSKVARLARVSIRALHHYDEIGLLSPSGRSRAGYRLYQHADLQRLQQVLFFRELGLFEAFGDFDPSEYENEVKERWGGTLAYEESVKRAKRYTKKDWEAIKAESERITKQLAALLASGRAPTEAKVMEVAEQHRCHIERWFYPCPRSMHRGLGELYVNDSRFTEKIDHVQPGLANYMRDAFRANADRDSS